MLGKISKDVRVLATSSSNGIISKSYLAGRNLNDLTREAYFSNLDQSLASGSASKYCKEAISMETGWIAETAHVFKHVLLLTYRL